MVVMSKLRVKAVMVHVDLLESLDLYIFANG